MSDTLITIIAIFLAALLMFIFPLMSVSERNDDIAQSVVQTATAQFVDKITKSGVIKPSDYAQYQQEISTTGHTYEISIEVQHIDDNPGKKTTQESGDLIGENVTYSTFKSEIEQAMYYEYVGGVLTLRGTPVNYQLNKGDNVIVTVKNTDKTIAQMLRTAMYKVTGQGTYQIAASSSGMVINTGPSN